MRYRLFSHDSKLSTTRYPSFEISLMGVLNTIVSDARTSPKEYTDVLARRFGQIWLNKNANSQR